MMFLPAFPLARRAQSVLPAFTLALAALALAWPASAQTPAPRRIGFVKFERIITESVAAKRVQTRLEQEFSTREKELLAQESALKSATESLKTDAPVLSDGQMRERQQKLAEQEREFQRKRRAFQEDLNVRKNEELQKLLAVANQAIGRLAEAAKLDFVVQEAVYVDPRNDITDAVLKALAEP